MAATGRFFRKVGQSLTIGEHLKKWVFGLFTHSLKMGEWCYLLPLHSGTD